MYLLKRFKNVFRSITVDKFTFHHVSIKTMLFACVLLSFPAFTFHHVSIKTHDDLVARLGRL